MGMTKALRFQDRAVAIVLVLAVHILLIVALLLLQPHVAKRRLARQNLSTFNFAPEPKPDPPKALQPVAPPPIEQPLVLLPPPVDSPAPPSGICPLPGVTPEPTDNGVAPLVARWADYMPFYSITAVDTNGDGSKDSLRWGEGLSPSTYEFTGSPPTTLATLKAGQTFCIGTFTHSNFPIFGRSLTEASLRIDFAAKVDGALVAVTGVKVDFTHVETPNSVTPEQARDIITVVTNDVAVEIAGHTHMLKVLGFIDPRDPANIITTIRTHEELSNSFGLAARFTPAS